MLHGHRRDEVFAVMGKGGESLKALGAPDEWEIVESIGEGTYGEVFKVRNTETGEMAAAKIIDSILEKIEEVLPELEILKKYSNHPNIAGFHGAYIKSDSKRQDQLWLIMELCRGGSVTNLVKNLISKGKLLDEDLIAYILYETLKGIEYLHRNNVMHRDIKGQNVMLTNDADIRLIDFGVSSELTHVLMKKNSSVGTPFWMAPEVIACEQQLDYSYDLRCDIWSLGITGIELADGLAPLADEHPMRALFKIPRSKPPTMKNPEKWSHEYRDFIANCLVKDFEERPFSTQLLKHPFLNWVPTKKLVLRRKLMALMDSQYHGQDGIMDEIRREKDKDAKYITPEKRPMSPRRNKDMLQVNDLATLSSLNEEAILSHLLERFLSNQIYTYIGDILIALNPLQTLNIYSKEHSHAYHNVNKDDLPPHIFTVADMTYQAMIHNKTPQCCLISGESGAGKTVSANYLVQQLAELGKGGNRTLEQKILQVNPLMEALGNAQTVINDNSSRFGKYLELHFTSNGALIGATLTEYLLEKSRVVFQASDERNFHIFYYMIAGLAHQKKLEKYSFKLYSQHSYLQTGGRNLQDVVCTLGNRKRFEEVQRCFDVIGFTHDEVSSLFSVLAAIIHMGDIVFTEDESVSHLSDKSMVTNPQLLVVVSSLLSINAVELRDALTTNSNVTRGETIIRNNTVDQAVDCRDAMAKVLYRDKIYDSRSLFYARNIRALYGRLFSWIVQRINALLRWVQGPPGLFVHSDNENRIGILDIFGFENFKNNSFEQLCINIANEQIQFYFNQQIFSWEIEEYREEGVALDGITYEDNRPVLDMFLQKPIGILALLDEESRFPKATDFTLVEKFNTNIKQRFYERTKEKDNFPSFSIKHYAGKVKYSAKNFLEKNRDTLSLDIVHVLRTSEIKLVRTLINQRSKGVSSSDDNPCWWRIPDSFKTEVMRTQKQIVISGDERGDNWLRNLLKVRNRNSFEVSKGRVIPNRVYTQPSQKVLVHLPEAKYNSSSTSRIHQTVSMHFRYSLKDLLSKLLPAQSHFVRCIRPNANMIPGRFDQEKVMTQLRYTGVLETTRIRKQGYSERPSFSDFVKRYQVVAFPMHAKVKRNANACKTILRAAHLDRWMMGKTKVFLKYYHVERLGKILEDYRVRVVIMQTAVRSWLARRKLAKLKKGRQDAVVNIQKVLRGFLARKMYRAEVERKRQLTLLLEEERRRKLEEEERKRRLECAIILQAATRGYLARKRCRRQREEIDARARLIQSAFRGHQVRRKLPEFKEAKISEVQRKGNIAKAATAIQAVIRGYRARKLYRFKKEEAEGNDIKTIFFFQQVVDSAQLFKEQQETERKIIAPIHPDPTRKHFDPLINHRDIGDIVRRLQETSETPFSRRPSFRTTLSTTDELDELGAQQETQRIFFLQQVEKSWPDFLEKVRSHVDHGPNLQDRSPKEWKLRFSSREPDVDSNPDVKKPDFSIRPRETSYSELQFKTSMRSQRSFRKEIWSAADEAYLRHFADDSIREAQSKEQGKRIQEMVKLVDGYSYDALKNPTWLRTSTDGTAVSNTRHVFERRSPSPPPSSTLERKESTDKPSSWHPMVRRQRSSQSLEQSASAIPAKLHKISDDTHSRNKDPAATHSKNTEDGQPKAKIPSEQPDRSAIPELKPAEKHFTKPIKNIEPDAVPGNELSLLVLRKTGLREQLVGIKEEKEDSISRITINMPLAVA